ncbi:PH domain-containing protein [Flavobacterium antarcticum]|uniref:PH domain-containing protein n=1 Tax=Flavobacterium antarcticum TaxID=271155 RepID=UPI0003B74CFF|nr:PH domain-containing protein [Flavobacterium antarcticum]
MTKVYKSKIGIEIILILGVTFGSVGVAMVMYGDHSPLLINLLIVAFIGYIFWKTEYTITGSNLNVKCSFLINQDIEISSIRRIKETYNPMSAPAESIDRLELIYNDSDSVVISPKKKKEFITHLLKINPKIHVVMRSDL